MQRITHIYFALFLFAIFWVIFGLGLEISIFVAFGAIFPDFDIAKPVRQYHRKLLHNVWVLLAVSMVISVLFIYPVPLIGIGWGLGFLLGGLSHLLMDSLTIRGIYPLWPLKKEKKGMHLFKDKNKWLLTGGRKERLFAIVVLFFGVFLFFLKLFDFDVLITIIVTVIVVSGLIEGEKYLPRIYRREENRK